MNRVSNVREINPETLFCLRTKKPKLKESNAIKNEVTVIETYNIPFFAIFRH